MKCADVAMYRAKEQGRNTCQFYRPEMNAHTHELLLLEGHLRQALEQKQLVLHYQPQIDLLSGRLVGLEALLRWQHPMQGLIAPDDFVPLAEETGLIVPIGEWVLQEACTQIKALQQAGMDPVRISVNISSRQIKQPGFIAMIDRVLEKTGFDPRGLILEITESSLMNNVEKTIKTLEEIKARGIHLSIDDFGTGYSSLRDLKRFPISQLKIDQSFVHDITANANDEAIAASIIALSRSMHMTVIAEGVETEEQLQLLQQMGCTQGQGYLISRPLPYEQLKNFMRKNVGSGAT
jgi:EAL domain-containing protein (putative c-di-GMP-specific phosphodiesterase class I)